MSLACDEPPLPLRHLCMSPSISAIRHNLTGLSAMQPSELRQAFLTASSALVRCFCRRRSPLDENSLKSKDDMKNTIHVYSEAVQPCQAASFGPSGEWSISLHTESICDFGTSRSFHGRSQRPEGGVTALQASVGQTRRRRMSRNAVRVRESRHRNDCLSVALVKLQFIHRV